MVKKRKLQLIGSIILLIIGVLGIFLILRIAKNDNYS